MLPVCPYLLSACLQVAGRMVKYSYYIARISSFIASKMQSSMSKNMVFPGCGDIKIMQLLVRPVNLTALPVHTVSLLPCLRLRCLFPPLQTPLLSPLFSSVSPLLLYPSFSLLH